MSKITKYSNLPNIALDQTDVYETSGQTEQNEESNEDKKLSNLNTSKFIKSDFSQSLLEQVNSTNDNIDTIDIKPKDAFAKFKDKYLATCFNESQLTYQKFGEWELINKSSRSEETPYQKYCRLKSEVNELASQLRCVDESKSSNKFQSDLKPSDILNNLSVLENQLNSLKIDDKKENVLFGIEVYEEIEKKLNEVKQDDKPDDQTESDKIIYQLFCNPNLSKLNDLTKAQKLEQRIKNLENILGNDFDELRKLPSYSEDKSIVEVVSTLSSKVAQLDSNHLEQIDSRLTSLIHKFNQLNDKKNELIDIEKQNKINDLYELVDKSNQNLDAVPSILARLENLEELQQQAIYFSDALTYLDTLQSQVHNSMQSNEEELKALKEIFAHNIESIKSLLSQYDKKISAKN